MWGLVFYMLYVRVGILLTWWKHLHDRIISLRREVQAHKSKLTPPLFLKCLYQSREVRGHVCISVLGVSILPLSTILIFDFGVVSSNPVHGEVYSIQHYVIKFVSDLRQFCGFLWLLRFPLPINLTTTI